MPETLKSVSHLDWYDSWDPTTKFALTPEGYLQGMASLTSIGVFEYRNADGTVRRELRLPQHVFDRDSLASLAGKPVTLDHPEVAVTAENVQEYEVGSVGDRIDSNSYEVFAQVTIRRKDAVAVISAGKNAVSCGYDCDLVAAPMGARHHGQAYDYIQTNIRYNHLSVVDKARAGDQAKLRLDGFSVQTQRLDTDAGENEKEATMPENMSKVRVDSLTYEVPAQVGVRFDAMEIELQNLRTDKLNLTKELSTVTADRDSNKDKLDATIKERDELKKTHVDMATATKQVRARLELEGFAKAQGVEVKDGMTDRQVQEAVIGKLKPNRKLDGVDDTYVAVTYDNLKKDAEDETAAEAKDRQDSISIPNRGASSKPSTTAEINAAADKARKDYLESLTNAHRAAPGKE